jgi:hypothetical protein
LKKSWGCLMINNKKRGNPNWGGSRLESKLIKKYADQWCRENGYPIQKRITKKIYYVQNTRSV